ncbi:MAG: hypothetical protein V4736_03260 [Bdellovibrionota bacterium]
MDTGFPWFRVKGLTLLLGAVLLSAAGCTDPYQTMSPTSMSEKDFSAITWDTYTDVSKPVSLIVDNYYAAYRELNKVRYSSSYTSGTDSCVAEVANQNTFADRISWAILKRMRPSRARLGYVAYAFGLPSNESTYVSNGLLSHPLCPVSSTVLNTTYQGQNIPSASTINKVNTFINTMNKYRDEAIAGNAGSQLKAQKLWSKFYMCLGYMESLTTADNSSNDTTAEKYLPTGVSRPAGVSFHESTLLNLGIYQFDPDSEGNTLSCIKEWNDFFPSCPISTTSTQTQMIKFLGSNFQTFNAFCGVTKLTNMMSVQINTTKARNTFPQNVATDGSLFQPANRCVGFTMNDNLSYNHFAPFQNGSGFTLNNIMTCTLNGAY